MNPFQGSSLAACAVLTTLLIAGCGQKADTSHAHESEGTEHAHEAEPGVTFNAKKGLLVPSDTAKFIGLKVADVEDRKIAAEFHFSAQIYRAASEVQFASLQSAELPATLASGDVSPVVVARLSAGQIVSVRSEDDSAPFPARIVTLKHGLANTSGQVEVLLAITDAPRPLATGAALSVSVSLGGEKAVVSVPRSALFRTTEGDFVYTVSGEHFVRTPVKLGVVNHEFAEVTDGLYAGDQIVVQPAMTLWMAELQSLRGGKACSDGQ